MKDTTRRNWWTVVLLISLCSIQDTMCESSRSQNVRQRRAQETTPQPTPRKIGLAPDLSPPPTVSPSLPPFTTLPPTTSPPTPSPSKQETLIPSSRPTGSPTGSPSGSPTLPSPSFTPTTSPSFAPTTSPSFTPTTSPSFTPSTSPSSQPTTSPSRAPSDTPSEKPSTSPSFKPTTPAPTDSIPSMEPSLRPTLGPTIAPSDSPTTSDVPTGGPSWSPTTSVVPSFGPSRRPTISPAPSPVLSVPPTTSMSPSVLPTNSPTTPSPTDSLPSQSPTTMSSLRPSFIPSALPSESAKQTPPTGGNTSNAHDKASSSAPSVKASTVSPSNVLSSSSPPTKETSSQQELTLDSVQMLLEEVGLLEVTSQRIWVNATARSIIRNVVTILNSQVEGITVELFLRSQNVDFVDDSSGGSSITKSTLTIFFNVRIGLQSVVTTHDVRRYVGGAFDSTDETDLFMQRLTRTQDEAFASIESVQLILPKVEQTESASNNRFQIGVTVGIGAVSMAVASFIVYAVYLLIGQFFDGGKPNSNRVAAVVTADNDNHSDGGWSFIRRSTATNGGGFVVSEYVKNEDISTLGDPIPQGTSVLVENSSIDTPSLPFDYKMAAAAAPMQNSLTREEHSYSTLSSNVLELSTDDGTLNAQYVMADSIEVDAPPGLLGMVLEEVVGGGGPAVRDMKENGPLTNQVKIGYILLSVDGIDVTAMPSSAVSLLIASKKKNPSRRLVFRPTSKT